jgi:hypothetical protein
VADTVLLLLQERQTELLEQDLQFPVQLRHAVPLINWLELHVQAPELRRNGEAQEVHALAEVQSRQFEEQLTQAFPSPFGAIPAAQEQAELERENPE